MLIESKTAKQQNSKTVLQHFPKQARQLKKTTTEKQVLGKKTIDLVYKKLVWVKINMLERQKQYGWSLNMI